MEAGARCVSRCIGLLDQRSGERGTTPRGSRLPVFLIFPIYNHVNWRHHTLVAGAVAGPVLSGKSRTRRRQDRHPSQRTQPLRHSQRDVAYVTLTASNHLPRRTVLPFFRGVRQFGANQTAAKELISYRVRMDNVRVGRDTVVRCDIPPFGSLLDFKGAELVEPRKGTVYNDPVRPFHKAAPHIAASPAPRDIAVQIYNRAPMPTMLAKLQRGQPVGQVIARTSDELKGFTC